METNEKVPTLERVYPLLFVLAYAFILFVVIWYVYPHFLNIYAGMGTELPMLTKICLGSEFRYSIYVPLIVLAAIRLATIDQRASRWYVITLHMTGILLIILAMVCIIAGLIGR